MGKSLASAMTAEPSPNSLAYWLAPLKGYWDRQGKISQEGLAMADQGAQSVRDGDMGGLAGLLLGPAGYLASPISALLPTSDETYAAGDIPEWAKPSVAGGLAGMMAVMPGPKIKNFGTAAKVAEAAQNLPPFTAYHGSPIEGLSALKPSERGPFGPASYLSPVKDVAGRYGSNVYETSLNPNEIFNGLGSRYFDGDVNGYEMWRNQVARVAKASGGKADEVAAVLGKLDPQDGYRAYHDLRRIMGSDAEAQAVLQRAGFKGMSGHVDGPEVAMFGDVSLGGAPEGITAYHGSPHTFDKFDMSKIGTGEGAQAYGHGLYFAEAPEVASAYRNNLSGVEVVDRNGKRIPLGMDNSAATDAANYLERHNGDFDRAAAAAIPDVADVLKQWKSEGAALKTLGGSTYQVRLNVKPDELLDWDAPLSKQPEGVRKTMVDLMERTPPVDHPGSTVYARVSEALGGARGLPNDQMTEALKARGVKGIRYKDAGSRGAEGGTYNYVIFDDGLVDILKRYGVAMTAGAGGAMVVSGQDIPPEVASQIGPQG